MNSAKRTLPPPARRTLRLYGRALTYSSVKRAQTARLCSPETHTLTPNNKTPPNFFRIWEIFVFLEGDMASVIHITQIGR
ncbi:hypothetical protein SDC9_55213 [bioreactor metagenome]|uniref:Uncharacterized protein n=1 Tax=bioreactor metagenome TaxID=1076179 RepID=A0A644WYW1_9ZZZZ